MNPIDNFQKLIELDKPWWADPAIEYIESLLKPEMKVFEYGSGASTIWFSKRVSEVVSQEANQEFYEFMKNQTDTKLLLKSQHNEEEYLGAIKEFGKFDIVLIDAAMRIKCLNQAPEFIKDDGYIIFDNSGWDKFQNGLAEFEAANPGWKKIVKRGEKLFNDGVEETTIYFK